MSRKQHSTGFSGNMCEIEISRKMIAAGDTFYREWEGRYDYENGSAALDCDVEEMLRGIFKSMVLAAHADS